MVDQFGRHIPDYPGQQPWQDPAYIRFANNQQAHMPQMPQVQQPAPQPVQQQQIQNGGFIGVRSEQEARNWPVAPGNSVTFKDETAPYCYIKTMSFNQFESPQFVKYRLVREDAQEPVEAPADAQPVPMPEYALKTDVEAMSAVIDEVKGEIAEFRGELYGLAGKKKGKKEDTADA